MGDKDESWRDALLDEELEKLFSGNKIVGAGTGMNGSGSTQKNFASTRPKFTTKEMPERT